MGVSSKGKGRDDCKTPSPLRERPFGKLRRGEGEIAGTQSCLALLTLLWIPVFAGMTG